jgi:hypothetical protein
MVRHDLLEAEPYDLVIGDEAWEVDYYLHENPELKRAPFVWLTDFVGWLPMGPGPARARRPSPPTATRRCSSRSRDSRACATARSSSATPTTSCPTTSAVMAVDGAPGRTDPVVRGSAGS